MKQCVGKKHKRKAKKSKTSAIWGGAILHLVAVFAAMIGFLWFSWTFPSVFDTILFVVLLIVILYSDNSGMRLFLTKRLPESVPFYKKLTRNPRIADRRTEFYKTIVFYCMLFNWYIPYCKYIFTGLVVIFVTLSIFRYIRRNDIVSFRGKTRNDLSATASTILLPSLLFAIAGMFNQTYSIILWLLMLIVSLAYAIPFFIFVKEYRQKISVAFGFIFCILLFSFGALRLINANFDFSQPEIYPVTVVDKYVAGGRSRTLYVTVTPWKDSENEDIVVERETYKEAQKGEQA